MPKSLPNTRKCFCVNNDEQWIESRRVNRPKAQLSEKQTDSPKRQVHSLLSQLISLSRNLSKRTLCDDDEKSNRRKQNSTLILRLRWKPEAKEAAKKRNEMFSPCLSEWRMGWVKREKNKWKAKSLVHPRRWETDGNEEKSSKTLLERSNKKASIIFLGWWQFFFLLFFPLVLSPECSDSLTLTHDNNDYHIWIYIWVAPKRFKHKEVLSVEEKSLENRDETVPKKLVTWRHRRSRIERSFQ